MKIDLEQVILDDDGQPKRNVVQKTDDLGLPVYNKDGSPCLESRGYLKLKDVLYTAVNAMYKDEHLDPERVFMRGKLAKKIKSGGEKNFDAEQIREMIGVVTKRYQFDPSLCTAIVEMIDPDNAKVRMAAERTEE